MMHFCLDFVGRDPPPPGLVWAISPGAQDKGSGLDRIEVTEGPGSGVKIQNHPAPPFSDLVNYAEANLSSRKQRNDLSGDIARKSLVVYDNDSWEALIKAIAD
jgi:ATP-dependent Lon protease